MVVAVGVVGGSVGGCMVRPTELWPRVVVVVGPAVGGWGSVGGAAAVDGGWHGVGRQVG